MSATMFVINEAVSSCCGQLVSNGKCNCQSRQPKQPLAGSCPQGTEQRTSYIGRNAAAPEPLGPVYNLFDPEVPAEQPTAEAAPVANSNPTINNGGGLPQTDWEAIFNQARPIVKPVTKPVTKPPVKNNDGAHVPLGHAVWNW